MDFYLTLIGVHLRGILKSCFPYLQWEQGILLGSSGGHCGCPHLPLLLPWERWVDMGEGSDPVRPRLSIFFECEDPQNSCLAWVSSLPPLWARGHCLNSWKPVWPQMGGQVSSGGISGKAASVWLAWLFPHVPLNSGGKDRHVICGPLEPHREVLCVEGSGVEDVGT